MDAAAEAGTDLWRRPESVWMEYVFEWNPLLAGKLVLTNISYLLLVLSQQKIMLPSFWDFEEEFSDIILHHAVQFVNCIILFELKW